MNKIIIASDNRNKIREFREMLPENAEVLSLKDVGFCDEIDENGNTFLENAVIKAKTVSLFLRAKGIFAPVYADDSGLSVDALNGAPGVHSARYAGVHGDDKANRALLLENLKGCRDRSARFVCVIVKYMPDDTFTYAVGETYGRILTEETGNNGFGYDCVFFSDDIKKSFGLASSEEKNAVSHRARALKAVLSNNENGKPS